MVLVGWTNGANGRWRYNCKKFKQIGEIRSFSNKFTVVIASLFPSILLNFFPTTVFSYSNKLSKCMGSLVYWDRRWPGGWGYEFRITFWPKQECKTLKGIEGITRRNEVGFEAMWLPCECRCFKSFFLKSELWLASYGALLLVLIMSNNQLQEATIIIAVHQC